ncbi:MAG: hypothetical protein Q9196_004136 [Gyalolechia fulgens]
MSGIPKRQWNEIASTESLPLPKRSKGSASQEKHEGPTPPKNASDTFQDLGIVSPLCDACTALGYKAPTPIQQEAIPLALSGRDLIGLAETGSGKTAAYALPILQALGKKPHIVVATPGRLLDHLENTKGFSLRNLKYLVLDEADRLLDLDFGDIIDKILKVLPRERRTYLFSATMTSKVESLQRASLSSPLRISLSTNKYQTVATLIQNYLFLPQKDKDLYLVYLLNRYAGQSVIVFTRTVNEAQRLALLARSLNMKAIPLHGQLSQSARLGALGKFRAGESVKILIATDVAARGLDIPLVDLVVNFDLPPDSKTYIHRVGRTARAGKSGKALSLVTQYDVEVWQRIESALGKKLEEYQTERDEVVVFGQTVGEAQREAVRKMKDLHEKRGTPGATLTGRRHKGGKSGRRGRDAMDREEG